MKRKEFIKLATKAGIVMGISSYACSDTQQSTEELISAYEKLMTALLAEWTDAMLAAQINKPESPEIHGALYCHACEKIHGRCMDAVYPFMHMATKTGDQRYLDAAVLVMEWSKNVSMPDGSWTVIPDPRSWRGITVFGAIALGEALHQHGHILPAELKKQWMARLEKATEFIYQNFTMTYSHVNYAFTAVYALNFLGRFFENSDYIDRSRELAREFPNWLTEPNLLIFGEDKPADKQSAKGLLPIDLGYNVEETLNGLVQYALLENDEKMLKMLTKSMQSHLEFMLPDGSWDNSWGTRQNKWSYWGSRTTDGCQPAFSLMANRDPAFGTAAFLNTELLQKCTVGGLLAGGLHYDSHQVKPCIHHTFAHAKSLAFLLDNAKRIPEISKSHPLPRSTQKGVKHFSELDVWLAAIGPWKATVSSYDNQFKTKYSQQATGGSLAVLWHNEIGPVFTASMAEYFLVEKNNQQPQPDGEDISLTPRIECFSDGKFCTNLFDLQAIVIAVDKEKAIQFDVITQLTDRDRIVLPNSEYELQYTFDQHKAIIKAKKRNEISMDGKAVLVLPVISASGEKLQQPTEHKIEIQREGGKIVIEANVPLSIRKTKRERIFNMVPGFEAVPIDADLTKAQQLVCSIVIE